MKALPRSASFAALLLLPAITFAQVRFTDVTADAGIKFVNNAGKEGKKYLPETMGSGVAFLDADGDGWQDILFVNSRGWTPAGPAQHRLAVP